MTSRHSDHIRHRVRWIMGQAALVILGIVTYFGVRGLTVGSGDTAVSHAHDVVALEENLGLDVEAAMQAPVLTSQSVETFANWVYIWGHWPVIVATMLWLAWHHRNTYLRLRDGMFVSGMLGMAVFVTYPLAPPRLADLGLVDTVTENSSAYRVLQPPAFVNQYAAMPSLHSGWDLLVGIAIFTAASSIALKAVGVLLPILMAYSVVATANHYVIDVVAGIALVLLGHAAALALERRRQRRAGRGDSSPSPGPDDGPPGDHDPVREVTPAP